MSQRNMAVRRWSKGERNANGVWINAGWTSVPIEKEENQYYKAKPTITHGEEKFTNPKTDMDIFKKIQDEIQFGTDKNRIDDLPNAMRQLFYSSDAWYISPGNQLFKIEDPETQALDGEWGSDADDSDTDNRLERNSTVRLFLEQSGIIQPEEHSSRITDIFGDIENSENDNKEMLPSSLGNRVYTSMDRISISPEESAISIIDGEPEIFSNEDKVQIKDPRLVNTALPYIPKKIMEMIYKQKEEFDSLLKKTTDEAERETVYDLFEDAVDRIVSPYLTNSLNSPFCARGYSAPRRKHDKIERSTVSEMSEAAGKRINLFHSLFREASDCITYDSLFGDKDGGFYGEIRLMNTHDRELSNKWSIKDKVDKDGNVIEVSAFNTQRTAYIRRWREEKRGDEEKLRVNLWVLFDSERGERKTTVIDKKNRETHVLKRYKDSIWRQDRVSALQELHLTVSQWDAVYTMLKVNKNRIELNKAHSTSRNILLKEMRDAFIKIDNLVDLETYMSSAEKRDWVMSSAKSGMKHIKKHGVIDIMKAVRYNTYKFNLSTIDQISVVDEILWRKSCAKKRKFLVQRAVLYRKMMDATTEVIDSGLGETTNSCYMPKCNSQTVDKIMFAKVDEDKGFLFIECEECGKSLWFLKHNEEPIAKTLDELKEAWEENN